MIQFVGPSIDWLKLDFDVFIKLKFTVQQVKHTKHHRIRTLVEMILTDCHSQVLILQEMLYLKILFYFINDKKKVALQDLIAWKKHHQLFPHALICP
jgi:hypothetical protein